MQLIRLQTTLDSTTPIFARAVFISELVSINQELAEAVMRLKEMQSTVLRNESRLAQHESGSDRLSADELVILKAQDQATTLQADSLQLLYRQKKFRQELLTNAIEILTPLIPDGDQDYTWNYDLAEYIEVTEVETDVTKSLVNIWKAQRSEKVLAKYLSAKEGCFNYAVQQLRKTTGTYQSLIGRTCG